MAQIRSQELLIIGAIAALVLVGCRQQDSFVGTWESTAANQGTNSTLTFNADHTMSFTASNGPHQQPYKLSGIGTWKANGKELTVTPLSMTLENMKPKDKEKMMPFVNAQINVPQTGPIEWKGRDEFLLTKNGVVQDFRKNQ